MQLLTRRAARVTWHQLSRFWVEFRGDLFTFVNEKWFGFILEKAFEGWWDGNSVKEL
jgi:hypothetical protein